MSQKLIKNEGIFKRNIDFSCLKTLRKYEKLYITLELRFQLFQNQQIFKKYFLTLMAGFMGHIYLQGTCPIVEVAALFQQTNAVITQEL